MADVKDPQKLVDDIAKQENAEDRAAVEKYVVEPVKKIGKRLYENVMGTPEQNKAAEASLEARKKAAAQKAHEEYTRDKKNWPLNPREDAINSAKAADAVTKKKGGKVSSYKSGGSVRSSASKRADGIAIRGRTRA